MIAGDGDVAAAHWACSLGGPEKPRRQARLVEGVAAWQKQAQVAVLIIRQAKPTLLDVPRVCHASPPLDGQRGHQALASDGLKLRFLHASCISKALSQRLLQQRVEAIHPATIVSSGTLHGFQPALGVISLIIGEREG